MKPMRQKTRELQDGLVEEQAEEWRPQNSGWSESVVELPGNSSASQLTVFVTICVSKGRSVRTTHRLTKPRASIGKIGGGADLQIDDPEACPLHCAVAITDSGVRLYDLDSLNGTYIDDERVQVVDLQDLSAFRIGSTEFVVSVGPNDR